MRTHTLSRAWQAQEYDAYICIPGACAHPSLLHISRGLHESNDAHALFTNAHALFKMHARTQATRESDAARTCAAADIQQLRMDVSRLMCDPSAGGAASGAVSAADAAALRRGAEFERRLAAGAASADSDRARIAKLEAQLAAAAAAAEGDRARITGARGRTPMKMCIHVSAYGKRQWAG